MEEIFVKNRETGEVKAVIECSGFAEELQTFLTCCFDKKAEEIIEVKKWAVSCSKECFCDALFLEEDDDLEECLESFAFSRIRSYADDDQEKRILASLFLKVTFNDEEEKVDLKFNSSVNEFFGENVEFILE